MLASMPNEPPTTTPPAPREPFRLLRTPPSGTPLGPGSPPPLRRPRAPAPAARAPALPPRADLAELAGTADGLRLAEGLRRELAHFRQWLPGQVAELARATGARRRALRGQALTVLAGVALTLLVALGSGAAALSWPAYGRLVTPLAARLAPGTSHRAHASGTNARQP